MDRALQIPAQRFVKPVPCFRVSPGAEAHRHTTLRADPLSAELKGPQQLLRTRPKIFDFDPDLGPKLGQTKPTISGTVPRQRHTTIPSDPTTIRHF